MDKDNKAYCYKKILMKEKFKVDLYSKINL